MADAPAPRKFLTDADKFRDVSRGNPKPFTLKGEALVKARLTPETWRLEVVGDASAQVEKPLRLEDGSALDLKALQELGKRHAVRLFKGMQCLNIAQPLGQGLWEGVPLREVLRLVGRTSNVRRLYYWGFHNNDPRQLFQSSLSLSQTLDAPPGETGPLVVWKLNGQPLSLIRGGPVRMLVPWAHGFKSIKWLQRIVLTNDHRANDTYADANNDPESYLKTMARLDEGLPQQFPSGKPVVLHGNAVVGWPGLKRVEYWLRPDAGTHGRLADDDPAWKAAKWQPCVLDPPPGDWAGTLPEGMQPKDVWGFDPDTGKPKEWPMRYSVTPWTATLTGLGAGAYEFRVRTVDQHGFAQPEPRVYLKSGINGIACHQFVVK